MLDKIIDLETKIAFLENSTAELSDVIYRQQLQIDQLNQMVDKLSQRLQAAMESEYSAQEIADEKPPHY